MTTSRPAHEYPFREPHELDLEPEYARLRVAEPLSRVRLPYGGEAWLATGHEDVRTVLNDPRFSRAALLGQGGPAGKGARVDHRPAEA